MAWSPAQLMATIKKNCINVVCGVRRREVGLLLCESDGDGDAKTI